MITYEYFALAAFDSDSMAKEREFEACFPVLSTTRNHVMRIAEQRALRAILIQRSEEEAQRVKDQAFSGTYSVEDLTDEEHETFLSYVAVWMDGAIVSLRAGRRYWGI